MRTCVVDLHKKRGKRPDYDVYIGRAVRNTKFTEDSKWCNPRGYSLELYRTYITNMIKMYPDEYNLDELRGKKLGCWCVNTCRTIPLVCHGQILLELINNEIQKEYRRV